MENKKNKGKFKERFHRIEVLLLVGLLVVVVGVISIQVVDFEREVPLFGGYVSAESIAQDLNSELHQSQMFDFLINEESFRFTSVRLNGFVEGEGPVQIYLMNERNENLLIYTNVKEKSGSGDLVTGLVAGEGQNEDDSQNFVLAQGQILSQLNVEPKENEELVEGAFYNECSETCFIDPLFSESANYKLVFYIGENVNLRINKIVFTKN